MNITIRKAVEKDSEKIWLLMKELAVFEKYTNSFAITPEIVKESGFRKNPPDFYCIRIQQTNYRNSRLLFSALHGTKPTSNLYEGAIC